jgi:predicted Zn-dependent peptidase
MKRIGLSEKILSNGLTVIHIQTGPSVIFEASVHFPVGSRHEPENQSGMTHLLEHMMFRGCGPYPKSTEFSKRLESICGETNAFTSAESTEFWFQCEASHHVECLELLGHFLTSPNFGEFEIERRIITSELDEDYNEAGALIDDYSLAMKTHFGNRGLGMPIGGTQAGVNSISLEDMKSYREKWYIPQNAILTLQSGFNPEQIFQECETIFGSWRSNTRDNRATSERPAPQPPNATGPHRVAVNDSNNQFSLRISFAVPCDPSNSEIIRAMEIIERLLDDGSASRLQSTIREEKGLVYSIAAQLDEFADALVFGIDAIVAPDHVIETCNEVTAQLHALVHSGPTPQELNHYVHRACFELEKLDERHHDFLERIVSGRFQARTFDKDSQTAAYRNLTTQAAQNAAAQIFKAQHQSIILVGPKAEDWIGKLASV